MTAEAALEARLSEPSPGLIDALARLPGDLIILGVGGKMGPSLARLARRGFDRAGQPRRVIGVARFGTPGLEDALRRDGVETIRADLLEPGAVDRLPDVPNVLFMAGQKFGTQSDQPRTWAINAYLPAIVANRYRGARLVAFSTGNVYPLWPTDTNGPDETAATAPVGEYAQSALARERLLTFFSERQGTPTVILRLNYAVEPRYGVLRDIGERVRAGVPVDLTMGHVNLIWQTDANAAALRSFSHASSPPLVLNLTGFPTITVRSIAERFGARLHIAPRFTGMEATTALLSDARVSHRYFGEPPTDLDSMIDAVASWMETGGRSLGKPTHFERRDGAF